MKTRIFTFLLAALPLALTAQASENSMDAGGMLPGSSSGAYTSSAKGDCASARSLYPEEHAAADSDSNDRHASAGTPGTRMRVSDEAAEETSSDTASGSSANGKLLAVPVKSRGTRWQSLVPGAIK